MTLKPTKAPRQSMPEQAPEVRIHNFDEVPLGYSPEQAVTEASRCLQCKRPACVEGCPVAVDIPGFVGLVREGKFAEAARKIKETNVLPAVCGRVCPQEDQCEICLLYTSDAADDLLCVALGGRRLIKTTTHTTTST